MNGPAAACPKCSEPMERREGVFFWRGQLAPGWVCGACNGLWAMKGAEIPPLEGTGL